MNVFRLCIALLLIPWLLVACAGLKVEPFPEPIRPPKALPESVSPSEEDASPADEEAREALRTIRTPGVVIQRSVAEGVADRLGEDLEGDPVRVSFHDVPLVPFINEVFGEELGMSFVISPGPTGQDRSRHAETHRATAAPAALRYRAPGAAGIRRRPDGSGRGDPHVRSESGDILA